MGYIRGGRGCGLLFISAMAKFTELTAFFLFANAYKYFQGNKGSYKLFYSQCNEPFNSMHDFYSNQWQEAADQLKNTYLGRLFMATDTLLKLLARSDESRTIRRLLLDLRNTLCYELYQSTRTLLLNSLEIL